MCRIDLRLKRIIQVQVQSYGIIKFYLAESVQVLSRLKLSAHERLFNSKDLLFGDQEVFLWLARKNYHMYLKDRMAIDNQLLENSLYGLKFLILMDIPVG